MGNQPKPAHHRGTHQQTSLHLRQAWTANPNTRCAHCGGTLQYGIQKWGRWGQWEADHKQPGNPNAGYQPAHAHCNRSHGAAHGNRQRRNATRSQW